MADISHECTIDNHRLCSDSQCECDCHVRQIVEVYTFSIDELKALARTLEHEFVSYEDSEARAAVNKIFEYVRKHG